MKAGTFDHPKMMELARLLGVCKNHAAGIMEHLWHWTARYAPQGDAGKYADDVIQQEVAPELAKKVRLIEALVKARWMDRADWADQDNGQEAGWPRLYVHDWHDHCEDRVRTWLTRNGLNFADGTPPRKPKEGDSVATMSRQCRDTDATKSRVSRELVTTHARAPKPEPKPEPVPCVAHTGFPDSFEAWILEFAAVPGYGVYQKTKRAEAERCWMEASGLVKALPVEAVEKAWREFMAKSLEKAFERPCSTWIRFLECAAPKENGGPYPAATGAKAQDGMPTAADVDEDDAEARRVKRIAKS